MNVAGKLSIFCVVFCAALCSADLPPKKVEGCLLVLLKAMGKLSRDFQSNSPPPAPIICYYANELATNMVKSVIHGDIKAKMPNDADCLIEKFDVRRTVFDVIKIRLIDSSRTLDDSEKERQLQEARNELTDVLEKIVADCPTDKETFINIFHIPLAIKNDTLEAQQAEYCLAKYTVDNKLLDLDAGVWNPHNITSENVDCDGIVAVERINSEREVRDLIAPMPKAGKNLDCIMDAFRTGNTSNAHTAMKVLAFLDLPEETKQMAGASHSAEFRNFLRTSIVSCVKSSNVVVE